MWTATIGEVISGAPTNSLTTARLLEKCLFSERTLAPSAEKRSEVAPLYTPMSSTRSPDRSRGKPAHLSTSVLSHRRLRFYCAGMVVPVLKVYGPLREI